MPLEMIKLHSSKKLVERLEQIQGLTDFGSITPNQRASLTFAAMCEDLLDAAQINYDKSIYYVVWDEIKNEQSENTKRVDEGQVESG